MPTGAGKSAGRVSVRVVPDSTGFRTDLKKALDRIEASSSLDIKVKADTSSLKEALVRAKETVREANPTLKVQTDLSSFNERFASIQRRLQGNPLNLELEADVTRAQRELEQFRTGLGIGPITIEAQANIDEAEKKIAILKAQARDAKIKIDIDVRKDAADKIQAFSDRVGNLQRQVAGNPLHLRLFADADKAEADLKKFRAEQGNGPLTIEAHANVLAAERAIAELRRKARDEEIALNVKPKVDSLALRIVKLEIVRLATDRVVNLVINVNKRSFLAAGSALASLSGGKSAVGYLRGIGSALSGLDKSIPKISAVALGVGSIGALGLSSVQGVLALASSLVSVAGAGLAVPGILAGIGIAGGTLAVALSGAKTALADLVPTLTKFQTSISGAFFKQAKGPIEDLVKTFGSQLLPAVKGVSTELGGFAASLAKSLTSGIKLGLFGDLFKNVADAINIAKGAIQPLVSAFGVLANVGADFLPALAQGFVDLTKKFDVFISTAAGDGSLDGWIQGGIAGLKSLGSVIGSVVGIVKGLFDAANAGTGGNGLAVFADTLKQISVVINSGGFQTALTTIFSGATAGAAGLASAIKPIGGLFQALAPTISGVFKTAGSVVGGALTAIANALKAPAFATGLTAFFNGIAAGVAAVLPVLPAIVGALGTVASTAGMVAAQLGPVFAASFAALAPVITQVLTELQPLIPVLGAALANSVSILGAALVVLAPIFSSIISAVAPLIPILAGALAGALATLGPAVLTIVQAIGGALPAVISAIATTVATLAPLVAQLVTGLAPLLPTVLGLVPILLQMATVFVSQLLPAITALLPQILQMSPLLAQILTSIAPLIPPLAQLVVAFLQLSVVLQTSVIPIFPIFIAALQGIVAAIQDTVTFVTTGLKILTAAFTGNFSAIPGIINSALGAAQGGVSRFVISVVASFTNLISSAVSRVVAFGSGIVSAASSAMASFLAKITSAISQAVSVIGSLPGKAKSALGNIAGTFVSVGGDIIRGIISGISGAIGALTSAITSAAKSALNAAKSALGINSPSRVFALEVGRHIPTGIAEGIKSSQGVLDSALTGMVNPALAGLNAARVSTPTLAAGSAAAAGNVYQFGDVINTSISAIVDEIERRQQLRDYQAAVNF